MVPKSIGTAHALKLYGFVPTISPFPVLHDAHSTTGSRPLLMIAIQRKRIWVDY